MARKEAAAGQAADLLEREAAVLRGVDHPLFVKYVDLVREPDRAMLYMEYAEGEDLTAFLRRRGPLPAEEAVRIAAALAEGLEYLHERPGRPIYRDLKPDNIRIAPDGRVKLVDLGCVCAAEDAGRSRAGSRGYAAPEQLGKGVCGPYSDVYALGRLLHQMLTGQDPCRPPFRKRAIRAYDPGLSPLLERLVEQCTAELPAERPPDMREVLRRLRPFLERRGRAEVWLRECGALARWFFSGKRWEADFLYEKNVKLP